MDFPRLDLHQLISEGHKALREEDYFRAVPLFRESIRRAPFRQELKDWLAMAVEGSLIQKETAPRPVQSTVAALRNKEVESSGDRVVEEIPEPPKPQAPPMPSPSVERMAVAKAPAFRSGASDRNRKAFAGHTRTSTKPSHFEKRHRRGPLSAMFIGALAGLVLIGSVVATVYFYMDSLVTAGLNDQGPSISRAQVNSIVEQAYSYRQKGEYALAISRLESLPEGAERSRLLAGTYMEQGNLNFHQDPPQYESAIEAYKNAVRNDPDEAEYGYSLGMAYLEFSRDKTSDAATSERYLDLARQTFEAVLARNPDHVGSLDGLSRVAVLQRDNVAAANAWRRIIEVAPDSYEAERARNNLKSLNYKF